MEGRKEGGGRGRGMNREERVDKEGINGVAEKREEEEEKQEEKGGKRGRRE